ncbi:MAG: HD domain-containing phosphohydrolase [Elusimicrobiota bacterium]
MTGFWILAALAAILLAALIAVLRRLYALEVNAPDPALAAAGRSVSPERLDELLTILLALHDYGVARTGNVSHEEFCSLVIDKACRLLNSKRGTVMLYDEDQKLLSVVAAKSPIPAGRPRLKLKPGEGVAGRAFKSGRPLQITKPKLDPRYVHPGGEDGNDDEPFLSVPMMLKSTPVGVLNIHDTGGTAVPDDTKLRFLTLLAGEAALTLHHQKMYDDLQVFYLQIVQMLARAVDEKDSYTQDRGEHSSELARAVADELGLPEQMARYMQYATMLHGIGKIGIDQAILSKPGKLTPQEFEQIKKHTTIGHRILARVKFLGPVSKMVLYHQEWYNGKGYPEGLRGEEIPLGSRIVAVINAWEAMNTDRPYRKALTREKALGELKRGAGTQFDPKVVEAFMRVEAREAEADGSTEPDPGAPAEETGRIDGAGTRESR